MMSVELHGTSCITAHEHQSPLWGNLLRNSLKLICDEPRSNVAFDINVRRYIELGKKAVKMAEDMLNAAEVGRCRLTISKVGSNYGVNA
jgi:hypothetical protein